MYSASMKLRVTASAKFASKDWLFGIYENRERSKNNFKEIILGIRPVWGDSLSYLDITLGMKPYGGLSLLHFMLSW